MSARPVYKNHILRYGYRKDLLIGTIKEIVSAYLPPPEVMCDAGQRVAFLHPNDQSEIFPAVWATEGHVCGVIPQVFQAAHAHAVSTGQLPRIIKDVPAHRARQHLLKLLLHILHS